MQLPSNNLNNIVIFLIKDAPVTVYNSKVATSYHFIEPTIEYIYSGEGYVVASEKDNVVPRDKDCIFVSDKDDSSDDISKCWELRIR